MLTRKKRRFALLIALFCTPLAFTFGQGVAINEDNSLAEGSAILEVLVSNLSFPIMLASGYILNLLQP
jgi:hypothetical protein